MRAAVVTRYGPAETVQIVERDDPQPRKGQLLVRVHAAAVTSADARIRAARFPRGFGVPARLAFGLRRPRRAVLGSAFSGEVVAVGPDVTDWQLGDALCGMTGAQMGAHAEMVVVSARRVVARPATVTDVDAAGVLFGGTTALHFLRDKVGVSANQSVLVNGAAGAVGTNLVQLARSMRATVTAVTSPANAGLVTQLGASEIIERPADAAANSAVQRLIRDGRRFDVVVDAVGTIDLGLGRQLLTNGGKLVLVVASLGQTLRARGNVIAGPAPERPGDFEDLLARVARKDLKVVIDQIVDLDGIVEAHRRIDSHRKVGNIVVTPA